MQNAPGFDGIVQSNMNTEKTTQMADVLSLDREKFLFWSLSIQQINQKYCMLMKSPNLKLCLSQTSFWVLY